MIQANDIRRYWKSTAAPIPLMAKFSTMKCRCWQARDISFFSAIRSGSVGRGDAFADIRGRYGCEDYQNLMDFLDEAIQAYPAIDPKRIAVSGGSYGGFMVNWMIGHTHRFACAISQRSIANFMTIYGLSDFGYYFVRDQLSADPLNEQDQARLWRHSPLRYAGQVKTPTLFLHRKTIIAARSARACRCLPL